MQSWATRLAGSCPSSMTQGLLHLQRPALKPVHAQVRESAAWPHSDGEAGASRDSMLAQADQLLDEGQLSAAAAMLRTAVRGALCRLACLAGQEGTGKPGADDRMLMPSLMSFWGADWSGPGMLDLGGGCAVSCRWGYGSSCFCSSLTQTSCCSPA